MTSTLTKFFGLFAISFLVLVVRSAVAETTSKKDCHLEDNVKNGFCKSLLENDGCFDGMVKPDGTADASFVEYVVYGCSKTCFCNMAETTSEKDCPLVDNVKNGFCESLLENDGCFDGMMKPDGTVDERQLKHILRGCAKTCLCQGVARKCK